MQKKRRQTQAGIETIRPHAPFVDALVSHARDPLQPGTSLYYAFQTAPVARRAPLADWIRWWHEVSAIPIAVQDAGVAEKKLHWWIQEIQAAQAGSPSHPLTQRLRPGTDEAPPVALWNTQLLGLISQLGQGRWLDEVARASHALETTGAATEGAAWLLGVRSEAGLRAARELGRPLRQAHQLARLGQDARIGLLHVPISTLQAHDVKAHELLRPQSSAPANWPQLMAHLQGTTSQELEAFHGQVRQLSQAERTALTPMSVLADLQAALIATINRQGDRVLHERIMLTPLRKWWISAWSRRRRS